MAYTSRVCPNYVPLAHSNHSPDPIFLVHHCHLLHEYHKHAITVRVEMPSTPKFHVVNVHYPFAMATRQEHGWDGYLMLASLWKITATPYGMLLASIGGTGIVRHKTCRPASPRICTTRRPYKNGGNICSKSATK